MTRPSISAVSERAPLRRSADDRLLLGVCAGIARSLDLAPLAVRLFAVALAAVAFPLVLGLYVVLAAIVPRDDGRVLLGGAPRDRRETLLGWSLVGLTLIWFAAEEFRLGGLVWPALSSFGVFAAAASALVLLALAQRREAHGGATATAATATPPASATAGNPADATITDERAAENGARRDAAGAEAAAEPGAETAAEPGADALDEPGADLVPDASHDGETPPQPGPGLMPAADAGVAPADAPTARFGADDTVIDGDAETMTFTAPPPRPPRRGPSVAVIGFGVLLIAAASVFLLDATGQIDLSATAVAVVLGAGAALAGAGAVAGAVTHRRGVIGLLALGVVLGGACASVALLEDELDAGVGVRTERPATVADLQDPYRLGVGQLDIDLSDTELPAGPTTVRADVAVGELDVLVPAGVRVESVGPTRVDGVAFVNDALEPGPLPKNKRRAAQERRERERAEAARPVVRIDADVREGDAEVIRVGG